MNTNPTRWQKATTEVLIGNLQAAEDFGATELARELRAELIRRMVEEVK